MAIQHTVSTSVKIALIGILQALILLPAPSYALPLEYTASYDIEKYGIVIAKSNYSLKHENNGVRMAQHTETVGLASLLSSNALDENSFLSTQNNQLLLTEFSYKQKSSDKKNRNIQLKIHWIQSDKKLLGKVSGTALGKKLEFKVDKPVWDTSSYHIPLMLNTRETSTPQQYTMMVKGQFKKYSFITHGVEEIEVNGNIVKSIKIERQNESKKNPVYLWLAPSLSNLPVKIEKWKNGKLQITSLLNHAQFPSNKSMEFKAIINENEEFD